MLSKIEKEICRLGEESGFFDGESTAIRLGELIKVYTYAPQTFVEKHENGFVIYHLGNTKIYDKQKENEVFQTARILAIREEALNKLFS